MICERDCEAEAIVGVGSPPVWVCFDHYEEWLQDIAAFMGQIRSLVR